MYLDIGGGVILYNVKHWGKITVYYGLVCKNSLFGSLPPAYKGES